MLSVCRLGQHLLKLAAQILQSSVDGGSKHFGALGGALQRPHARVQRAEEAVLDGIHLRGREVVIDEMLQPFALLYDPSKHLRLYDGAGLGGVVRTMRPAYLEFTDPALEAGRHTMQ